MTETLELKVKRGGIRLDKYIAENSELSRAHIQKLIDEGMILVNGCPAKASHKVITGGKIIITLPPSLLSSQAPEHIPLNIVYEDDNIMVVDKPAGLTVHPAAGHPTGTLVNAILAHCPNLNVKGSMRPGIVHRLDKDTSGLIVVAKNDVVQMELSRQIKERKISKDYLALVSGYLSPWKGTIEAPIGRHPRHRQRMAVVSGGREAQTPYEVKEYLDDYSLVEVHPQTGRTHQIRVHFSSIGHPVVGDSVYGKRSRLVARQFLHARRLGLKIPGGEHFNSFESPLPQDLKQSLTKIREEPR